MSREQKPYLVTGHPRSGTAYVAKLLQAGGLDIRHEQNDGKDGICSWMFAADTYWVPFFHGGGKGRKYFAFDKTLQVVRDPLALAASVAFTENSNAMSLAYRAIFTPLSFGRDTVRVAVESIIGWHDFIAETLQPAATIRVEHAADDLLTCVEGWRKSAKNEMPPKNINARPHQPITWGEIETRAGAVLAARYRTLAQDWGYRAENKEKTA